MDNDKLIEATRYFKQAEAVRDAKSFDELTRLLSEFFMHEANRLRAEGSR